MEIPPAQVIHQDKYPEKLKPFSDAFDWKITPFSAIEDVSGTVATAKSHMAIARLAKEKGFPWVMIFEEDCVPSADCTSRFMSILPVLLKHRNDWDLFLGGPTEVQFPIVRVNGTPPLYRVGSARSLPMQILNASAYDTALRWTPDDGPIDVQQGRKFRIACTQPHLVRAPASSEQLADSDRTLIQSEYRMKQVQVAFGSLCLAIFAIVWFSTRT